MPAGCLDGVVQVSCMPRKALEEELEEERRALLGALPGALRAAGLPLVMPNLAGNSGRPQPAKYDELVSTAERPTPREASSSRCG